MAKAFQIEDRKMPRLSTSNETEVLLFAEPSLVIKYMQVKHG